MASKVGNHQLSPDVLPELQSGAEWLKTTAHFERLEKENYYYCVNKEELPDKFQQVLEELNYISSESESRVIAIRFDEQATVPVKKGSTVDVIPISIEPGAIPTIDGETFEIGQYVSLTEEAQVTPAFYSLLLLRQGAEST